MLVCVCVCVEVCLCRTVNSAALVVLRGSFLGRPIVCTCHPSVSCIQAFASEALCVGVCVCVGL